MEFRWGVDTLAVGTISQIGMTGQFLNVFNSNQFRVYDSAIVGMILVGATVVWHTESRGLRVKSLSDILTVRE